MSLLGKVAWGAAKKIAEYTLADIVEGNNEVFNSIKDSAIKSHDEKILKLAAGRKIFVIESDSNKGKGSVKGETGDVYYYDKTTSGKEYCVYDKNKNIIANIAGSSSGGNIRYTNCTRLRVHANTSIKGTYYNVSFHKIKEKTIEKKSFLRTLVDTLEPETTENTGWKIVSDLMGGTKKFWCSDVMVGESKLSLSLVSNAEYYLFLDDVDFLETIVLMTLAINVVDVYSNEESIEAYDRYERRERREEKREKKKETTDSKTNRKSETKERKKWKWVDNDIYYDIDDDD